MSRRGEVDVESPFNTPLMQQYRQIKAQNKDAILFFRLGDFYEMFEEDAIIASKVLGIVLTSRQKGEVEKIPMAGVPYHSAQGYIAKLIKAGYRVAVCEQMEEPYKGKKLVRREVVRLVTSGTVIDEKLLEQKENNFLVAICRKDRAIGLATVDATTGEFAVAEMADDPSQLINELVRLRPAECILPKSEEDRDLSRLLKRELETVFYLLDDVAFDYKRAYRRLTEHFKTQSLKGYGCEGLAAGVSAAGAALNYLLETQKADLSHISGLYTYLPSDFMILDRAACYNLELTRSMREGDKRGSLLGVIDNTATPMGGRMIRDWLLRPLMDVEKVKSRLDAVEELSTDKFMRDGLREALKAIYDIERLVGRIGCGAANAPDLLALARSLSIIPEIKKTLSEAKSNLLRSLADGLDEMGDVNELVARSIADDPPGGIKEGGIIREGYDDELEALRQASREGKEWIANLENSERKRTGINSLKVGFNSVFGYYIEVTKPNLNLVPPDYIRKQTMVGAERFITPELQKYEAVVLEAEEKMADLEYRLFLKIRERLSQEATRLQDVARRLATLDVLSTFAHNALVHNYAKPEVDDGSRIVIKDGRHPVVEVALKTPFVPNDVELDSENFSLLIITGPNTSGKSTFIRQVALIVLLAQIGSFVPAKEAHIGVVDRIFTRVGASDDLARGESTFMVEMNETANILNNATPRSLLVLDEIGRGTSTFDGVSIAWAVAEYIHGTDSWEGIGAKALFATHYHELTGLAKALKRAKNYTVAVSERNGQVIFLRKIIPGSVDRSYGIHVAQLAGLPPEVVDRANQILSDLEKDGLKDKIDIEKIRPAASPVQLSLFTLGPDPIIEELKKLDLTNMTPIQALNKLEELKKEAIRRGKG